MYKVLFKNINKTVREVFVESEQHKGNLLGMSFKLLPYDRSGSRLKRMYSFVKGIIHPVYNFGYGTSHIDWDDKNSDTAIKVCLTASKAKEVFSKEEREEFKQMIEVLLPKMLANYGPNVITRGPIGPRQYYDINYRFHRLSEIFEENGYPYARTFKDQRGNCYLAHSRKPFRFFGWTKRKAIKWGLMVVDKTPEYKTDGVL